VQKEPERAPRGRRYPNPSALQVQQRAPEVAYLTDGAEIGGRLTFAF